MQTPPQFVIHVPEQGEDREETRPVAHVGRAQLVDAGHAHSRRPGQCRPGEDGSVRRQALPADPRLPPAAWRGHAGAGQGQRGRHRRRHPARGEPRHGRHAAHTDYRGALAGRGDLQRFPTRRQRRHRPEQLRRGREPEDGHLHEGRIQARRRLADHPKRTQRRERSHGPVGPAHPTLLLQRPQCEQRQDGLGLQQDRQSHVDPGELLQLRDQLQLFDLEHPRLPEAGPDEGLPDDRGQLLRGCQQLRRRPPPTSCGSRSPRGLEPSPPAPPPPRSAPGRSRGSSTRTARRPSRQRRPSRRTHPRPATSCRCRTSNARRTVEPGRSSRCSR